MDLSFTKRQTNQWVSGVEKNQWVSRMKTAKESVVWLYIKQLNNIEWVWRTFLSRCFSLSTWRRKLVQTYDGCLCCLNQQIVLTGLFPWNRIKSKWFSVFRHLFFPCWLMVCFDCQFQMKTSTFSNKNYNCLSPFSSIKYLSFMLSYFSSEQT